MSKIINTKGYRAGTIYRIALENFLTYKQVELYPGSLLNLIIGPNGTGKSSFLCAIILGLSGNTSVIGRAKKISEYVKRGCQESTIEIELYREPGQRNVIITRNFNLNDASTWYLDHKKETKKQVQQVIASMNIQVDNLCQLLPQDKVQDFTKMNPQQLLRSTLSAVGGQNSVALLDQLIESRNEQKLLSTKLQNNAQLLQEQIRLNERLKVVIDAMTQRKEIEKEIEICKNKIRWLEYHELREKFMEFKRQKNATTKSLETSKTKMADLEKNIEKAKIGIKRLEQQKLSANREVRTLQDRVKEMIDSVKSEERTIKEIQSDFDQKVEKQRNRERELTEAKFVLDKLIIDRTTLVEKVGDGASETYKSRWFAFDSLKFLDNRNKPRKRTNTVKKMEHSASLQKEVQRAGSAVEAAVPTKLWHYRLGNLCWKEARVKMELEELQKPISTINADIHTANKQKLEIQYYLDSDLKSQMSLLQMKIRHLEDVDENRLQVLRNYSEDSYKAVMWLRENKHMFSEPVHEPMMLKINFKDDKFARYLESIIPARDLVSFTFESIQDMNLFLKKVHSEGGLKRVNAVCSRGNYNVKTNNILQLSYLGFYIYLVDTITAPDAIMRYLCQNYNIHNIPIGNQYTYKNSDNVPSNINCFFSDNYSFKIIISAYSGAKSSTITEIRPAELLANTVDVDELNNLKTQLKNLDAPAQFYTSKIQDIDSKVAALEFNLNTLITKGNKIKQGVETIKILGVRIRMQNKKIDEIEKETAYNLEEEKELCKKKQKECVLKQCRVQKELLAIMKSLQEIIFNEEMLKVKLDFSRNSIAQLEADLSGLKNEESNVQETLENIEKAFNRAKSHAQEKLLEAKKSGKLPNDPDFPDKENFDKLPCNVNALLDHCHELHTRIACIDNGDQQQVVNEYEERKIQIAKLNNEVRNSSIMNKILENKIKTLSSQWLPPLDKLLKDVDKSFGEMFAKLGCAGEIKLDKGGSDEDYNKYGICILVRFRTSEQLQQLTSQIQSGGERAVSTAVYLMALQRLTAAPFRCVDEINQGMDPINERKIFDLLVNITTETDNAQYFLLTPKLLSNLEYNEKIMVHTIMNGKGIMSNRKWKCNKFLERARRYREHLE